MKATPDDQKKQIVLSWQYPGEVKSFRIYRARNNDPFVLYATQHGTLHEWADEDVHLGNVYTYKINAVLKGDVKTEMSRVIAVKY